MYPKIELEGKVCLVTAASRKLGAEIARAFAAYGTNLIINYWKSADIAHDLCTELQGMGVKALAVKANISEIGDVAQLVNSSMKVFSQVDFLVNNAGCFVEVPFLDLSIADFDYVIDGNLRSTFYITQLVAREMKARGKGVVVNIAASSAFNYKNSVYGLAKAGIVHLTSMMATELAPEVRINALAPDLIAENEDNKPESVQKVLAESPMQRLVSRREIAEMTCLLCTSQFDFVTGQTILMDGGRLFA